MTDRPYENDPTQPGGQNEPAPPPNPWTSPAAPGGPEQPAGSSVPPAPDYGAPSYGGTTPPPPSGSPMPPPPYGNAPSGGPNPPQYGTPDYGQRPSYTQAPPPQAGAYAFGDAAVLPNGLIPAPWWKRVVARLIDFVVSLLLTFVFWGVLGDAYMAKVQEVTSTSFSVNYQTTPLGSAIQFIVAVITEVVLVAVLGGQIGKLVMGIRIAEAETGKIGPGWLRAIGRWLLLSVAFACCVIPGLVCVLSPLWTGPKRQGYHDMAVGTVVVEKPKQ